MENNLPRNRQIMLFKSPDHQSSDIIPILFFIAIIMQTFIVEFTNETIMGPLAK